MNTTLSLLFLKNDSDLKINHQVQEFPYPVEGHPIRIKTTETTMPEKKIMKPVFIFSGLDTFEGRDIFSIGYSKVCL